MCLFPCLGRLHDEMGVPASFQSRNRFADFYFAIQVRKTQAAIKHALTERFYAWEDARKLAQQDPEVDLSGEGPAYAPSGSHLEEAVPEAASEEDFKEQSAAGGSSGAAKETKSSEEAIDPSTIPNAAKTQTDAPRV